MRIKLSIITAFFFALFLQQSAWATPQVETTVSDNSVFLGDRFILTITINDTDSDFQLDTKPLEKEFKVSSPSRRSNKNYINGEWSYLTEWKVSLRAKRLGELTIPSLKIGNLNSEPVTISVSKPSAQATKTRNNQIFIENSLNKNSVYLNQPLIFTSKIFIAQNKNTSDLQLMNPDLANATVAVYGKGKEEVTIRNGIRYNIITRQFQIEVSKAGTFTIVSPLLTGNIWQDRFASKPLNIRGDSLQVTVKVKPANYQGEWLISEDVHLFETPPLAGQNYRVGEPITRSITLQIASIDKDKLPKIPFNYPKNLRFYPDQDEFKEGQANGLQYAQRTMRHAIIADQAGELTLPEIKLAWWNSTTDQQEFAVLPAQTLTILAAEKQPAEVPVDKVATPVTDKEQTATKIVVDNKALIVWQIVCALLLLALIMLIFYHLSYRRSQSTDKKNSKKPVQLLNQASVSLLDTLSKQQASPAYQALLNYAQSEYPTLKSLSQLPVQMNLDVQDKTELAAEIKALENACANPSTIWNSAKLAKLIKKHQRQKDARVNEDIMDLNPS